MSTMRCARCGQTVLTARADATPRGTFDGNGPRPSFAAVLDDLVSMVAPFLPAAPDAHTGPCGRLCGEAMFDGVSRHTGPDCFACSQRASGRVGS